MNCSITHDDFINSLPVEETIILELFDFLNIQLGKNNCNQDYQFTMEFLKQKGIESNELIEWFQQYGGYCDCEILYHIEGKFYE